MNGAGRDARPDDESIDGLWGWDDGSPPRPGPTSPPPVPPPAPGPPSQEPSVWDFPGWDVPGPEAPVRDVPFSQPSAPATPWVRGPSTGPVSRSSPGNPVLVPVLAGILVGILVLGAIGVAVWGGLDGTPSTAGVSSPAPPDRSGLDGATGSSDPGSTSPPSTADLPDDPASALQSLRDADLPTVTLDSSWVAQLASKSIGIVDPGQTAADGSHVFGAADILAEHRRLRDGDNLGARVVLLLSTDYGQRQVVTGSPMWVTFALGGFTSSDDVQTWCHRRFPDLADAQLTNACAVRRLRPPA